MELCHTTGSSSDSTPHHSRHQNNSHQHYSFSFCGQQNCRCCVSVRKTANSFTEEGGGEDRSHTLHGEAQRREATAADRPQRQSGVCGGRKQKELDSQHFRYHKGRDQQRRPAEVSACTHTGSHIIHVAFSVLSCSVVEEDTYQKTLNHLDSRCLAGTRTPHSVVLVELKERERGGRGYRQSERTCELVSVSQPLGLYSQSTI